jgi:hypothetical protein
MSPRKGLDTKTNGLTVSRKRYYYYYYYFLYCFV